MSEQLTITRDPGNSHGCGDVADVQRIDGGYAVTAVHNCHAHPWQIGGNDEYADNDWITVGTTLTVDEAKRMDVQPL